MSYQVEGLIEGQWSWKHVSSDQNEEATLFEEEDEAQQALEELARIFECEPDTLRVVERD